MELNEILKKFANDETLKFKEDKMLSLIDGYLEISPKSFSIYGGNLWFKKKRTYEWKQVKEFGVNDYSQYNNSTFLLDLLTRSRSSTSNIIENSVGFNFKAEYSKLAKCKKWSFTHRLNQIIGCKYMDGICYDSYGFENEDLAFMLNSCLEIYRLKNDKSIS